ncbi:MAG: leucyl/phenylalanyl-tRNA--protein transferase [Fibrobacterota bacterium]
MISRKRKSFFPDSCEADENGIVAVSKEIDSYMLKEAYLNGIFPWPCGLPDNLIPWFSPDPRAILFLEDFSPGRTFKKEIRKEKFSISFNSDFSSVIRNCAMVARNGQEGTWLLPEMVSAYEDLYDEGHVLSVEARLPGGEIAGGLYGVYIKGCFSGESMFHKVSSASKYAFSALIDRLKKDELSWIDIQQMTPFFKKLGAVNIPRKKYLLLLKDSLRG